MYSEASNFETTPNSLTFDAYQQKTG